MSLKHYFREAKNYVSSGYHCVYLLLLILILSMHILITGKYSIKLRSQISRGSLHLSHWKYNWDQGQIDLNLDKSEPSKQVPACRHSQIIARKPWTWEEYQKRFPHFTGLSAFATMLVTSCKYDRKQQPNTPCLLTQEIVWAFRCMTPACF